MRFCYNVCLRPLYLALIASLFLSPISVLSQVQSEKEVVRIETNFVSIPVSVLDKQGRYMPGLKKDDFKIFENGAEQEIAFFEPNEQPFTVMVLIGVSCSMHEYLPDAARAANAFIGQLRPDDRVIVATFSEDALIHVILGPITKKDVHTPITLVQPPRFGFTTTFDAVERGIDYMKEFKGRKAIVLFSDGQLFGRHASAKSNLRVAQEQDSMIYPIRFGRFPAYDAGEAYRVLNAREQQVSDNTWSSAEKESLVGSKPIHSTLPMPGGLILRSSSEKKIAELLQRINAYMDGLARASGGRYFEVERIGDLEETFSVIAGELSRQYRLGYLPGITAKAGERRGIKVQVNAPGAAVRSRTEVVYRKPRH